MVKSATNSCLNKAYAAHTYFFAKGQQSLLAFRKTRYLRAVLGSKGRKKHKYVKDTALRSP